MKILVIPDVHLKPWMFDSAEEVMKTLQKQYPTDSWNFVCLGDIPDDFHQQGNTKLYEDTWNRVIKFAVDHPRALWCYGNHDLSYAWSRVETGFSFQNEGICRYGLKRLELQAKDNLQYLHLIDNVLFSHGGLNASFVFQHVPYKHRRNIQFVVNRINLLHETDMWKDWSPIWFRPSEYSRVKMFYPRKLLQVTGHTPVKTTNRIKGTLFCDTFSTHSDGSPYGDQKFTVVDTVTREWFTIQREVQ